MRTFLLAVWCIIFFAAYGCADQSEMEAMKQAYAEFVQIDAKIEALLKQKLELKAEMAQHLGREETAIRPRVEMRQNEEIEALSHQIQTISYELAQLEQKRSSILITLQ